MSQRIVVVRDEPRPNGWWGMLLLLATEGALFGTLIATYFYLRFQTQGWPPGAIEAPHVMRPLALTVLLVLTSVLMILLVLLHKGRGGGLSDMFGGGVSSSLGGSSVAERNLDRFTIGIGVIWFACVIALGLLLAYQ